MTPNKQNPADQREVMQQAFDALDSLADHDGCDSEAWDAAYASDALRCLRQALSAPPESVPNTFKLTNENDDAWIDRITGAELPPESAAAVAWMTEDGRVATDKTKTSCMPDAAFSSYKIPLYLIAPAREPLTGDQIYKWWASENCMEDCDMCKLADFIKVVRAIEAAHNIKAAK